MCDPWDSADNLGIDLVWWCEDVQHRPHLHIFTCPGAPVTAGQPRYSATAASAPPSKMCSRAPHMNGWGTDTLTWDHRGKHREAMWEA